MRTRLSGVAVATWGFGVGLAIQRGWLDGVPDWAVVALLLLPIAVFLCLFVTSERVLAFFQNTHRAISLAICVFAIGLLGGSIWFAANKLQIRKSSPPPIAVTGIFVLEPYEIGKQLDAKIVINNTVSGLKLRSAHLVFLAVANESDFVPETRRQNEKLIWQQYEEHARNSVPESLTGIAGLMTQRIEPVILEEADVKKLKNENGVVYVLGQIDYGTGTLDYCSYIQPARNKTADLCIEHNGPVPRPAFK